MGGGEPRIEFELIVSVVGILTGIGSIILAFYSLWASEDRRKSTESIGERNRLEAQDDRTRNRAEIERTLDRVERILEEDRNKTNDMFRDITKMSVAHNMEMSRSFNKDNIASPTNNFTPPKLTEKVTISGNVTSNWQI